VKVGRNVVLTETMGPEGGREETLACEERKRVGAEEKKVQRKTYKKKVQ
jgi:hypothetical protein